MAYIQENWQKLLVNFQKIKQDILKYYFLHE